MNLSSRSRLRKLSISGVRCSRASSKSSATRMSASTVHARVRLSSSFLEAHDRNLLLGITSSSNLTRLRNEATALRNRQVFQRSQLTELVNNDIESWAKESFEIATKIAYRNGRL